MPLAPGLDDNTLPFAFITGILFLLPIRCLVTWIMGAVVAGALCYIYALLEPVGHVSRFLNLLGSIAL